MYNDEPYIDRSDPRLTTRSEVSRVKALAERVRFAADHPLPGRTKYPMASCARYWGSDGTLCSTHHGRFAAHSEARCDFAQAHR